MYLMEAGETEHKPTKITLLFHQFFCLLLPIHLLQTSKNIDIKVDCHSHVVHEHSYPFIS